jgi:hypothetical protein
MSRVLISRQFQWSQFQLSRPILSWAKTICKELSSARNRQKPLESFFSFNNDYLAQHRPRVLKLINLFFSNCLKVRILNMSLKLLHMSLNEMASQNVWSVHKKSLWWNRCFLGWHVVDESEKWGHIWDTACGKSVNVMGSWD